VVFGLLLGLLAIRGLSAGAAVGLPPTAQTEAPQERAEQQQTEQPERQNAGPSALPAWFFALPAEPAYQQPAVTAPAQDLAETR
jgi:hypothetical protein